MLGCSRLVGQLTRTLSAWPLPLISAGMPSCVAGVATRVSSMPVPLGKVPGCNGGPIARWSWCGRVRDAGTMRGRWRGPVVAEHGLRALLGGGSHCQMVRTGFWRQMVVSWFDSGGWCATTMHLWGKICNFALVGNLWCAARRWFGFISCILMQRLGDTCARAYYSTPYMGTDGR